MCFIPDEDAATKTGLQDIESNIDLVILKSDRTKNTFNIPLVIQILIGSLFLQQMRWCWERVSKDRIYKDNNCNILDICLENVFSFLFIKCPTSGRVVSLKTGRREMIGSNPGRTCRPSRSEFSVVFFRNWRKYGLGSLRKTSHGGHATYRPRSHNQTVGFQPTTNPFLTKY